MTAIVIGGTHGLGWEIAQQLRATGQIVFVTGRSFTTAQHGAGAFLDLADEHSVANIVSFVQSTDVAFDLYWVAGYGYMGDFSDQLDAKRLAEVNFSGVLPIIQTVWSKMMGSDEDSRLVIVSSTTGIKARANEAVYAATKHAQVGLARSLGLESERLESRIKVSLFLPGGMQTQFWDNGERPAVFDEFLDPSKVAGVIIKDATAQPDHFYERVIERGSL